MMESMDQDRDEDREEAGADEAEEPSHAGPPFKGTYDPVPVQDRCGTAFRHEYNRTIREFVETGAVEDKVFEDFAHYINPPGANAAAFLAYGEACEAIEQWQDEEREEAVQASGIVPGAAQAEPSPAVPESDLEGEDDVDEDAELESDLDEDAEESEPGFEVEAGQGAATNNRPVGTETIPSTVMPSSAVMLRGEVFDPEATGLKEWDQPRPIAKLSVSVETRRVFRQEMPPEATESLLNAMIGEMHFNMREVAFRSMCQATELDDRMKWVDATVKMAEAGAKVGEVVAHLRGAAVPAGPRPRSRSKR